LTNDSSVELVPVADRTRRKTMRTAGTVIMLSSMVVLISAVLRQAWLNAAYWGVVTTYGAMLVWAWPFNSKQTRAAAILVVVSLILAAVILWPNS
jgi:hypothetical protein